MYAVMLKEVNFELITSLCHVIDLCHVDRPAFCGLLCFSKDPMIFPLGAEILAFWDLVIYSRFRSCCGEGTLIGNNTGSNLTRLAGRQWNEGINVIGCVFNPVPGLQLKLK